MANLGENTVIAQAILRLTFSKCLVASCVDGTDFVAVARVASLTTHQVEVSVDADVAVPSLHMGFAAAIARVRVAHRQLF